jgi:hypothetical protein
MKKIYYLVSIFFLSITGIAAQNAQYLGVMSGNPEISENWGVDDVTRHMYIWDGTLAESGIEPAVSYGAPLAFAGQNPDWWGFGLWDDEGADISDFTDGNLVFYIASDYSGDIEIIISDNTPAENEMKWILTTVDFPRDGNWHLIELPISDAVDAGVDLTTMGHVFAAAGGGQPGLIAFDDIYYSTEGVITAINNSTEDISVSLSPNPVSEKLMITLSGDIEQISVISMAGTTIFQNPDLMGKNKLDLNVSSWSKGIYFVIATGNQGNKKTQKIIVL